MLIISTIIVLIPVIIICTLLENELFYGRTSIKRPNLYFATSGQSPAKIASYTMCTSIKTSVQGPPLLINRPRSGSCRPKADLVLYLYIKRTGRFKVGRFQPDEGKRTTVWKRNCFFGFVNAMDHIITIIVLLILHLHMFVLVFDKLKAGSTTPNVALG